MPTIYTQNILDAVNYTASNTYWQFVCILHLNSAGWIYARTTKIEERLRTYDAENDAACNTGIHLTASTTFI